MPYKTLDQMNTSEGLHILFYYVADIVPGFMALVLTAFFLICCLGSFFMQRRLTARGDFPASFAVAGFLTAVVAIVAMALIPNLVNLVTVVFCIGVAILGIIWLYFSRSTASY